MTGTIEQRPRSISDATAWVTATYVVVAVVTLSLMKWPTMAHWGMLPIMLAGVLIGVDAVRLVLGRYDILDPRAVVGAFGFHFFFLAPLLHLAWNYWPRYMPPAQNWQDSLGTLASINVLGLILYRIIVARGMLSGGPTRRASTSARGILGGGIAFSALGLMLYGVVILRFGGLGNYISVAADNRSALAGTGPLLVFAESWPLVVFVTFVVWKRRFLRQHFWVVVLLLSIFVLAQFVTGGLRGSRANTIWPLAISIGVVHLLVARVTRRTLVVAGLLAGAFMYVYGVYKNVGSDVVPALRGDSELSQVAEDVGRSGELLILEDLGRAGTQSALVDRLQHLDTPPLGFGVTYVGDVVKLFPSRVNLADVPDKVDVGTQFLYGTEALGSEWRSSRIYGLVGEAMINFGLAAGVAVFVPFAFVVRRVTRFYLDAVSSQDIGSLILAPIMSVSLLLLLGSDFDNFVYFQLKHLLPLAIVVWIARTSSQSKTVPFPSMPPDRAVDGSQSGAANARVSTRP